MSQTSDLNADSRQQVRAILAKHGKCDSSDAVFRDLLAWCEAGGSRGGSTSDTVAGDADASMSSGGGSGSSSSSSPTNDGSKLSNPALETTSATASSITVEASATSGTTPPTATSTGKATEAKATTNGNESDKNGIHANDNTTVRVAALETVEYTLLLLSGDEILVPLLGGHVVDDSISAAALRSAAWAKLNQLDKFRDRPIPDCMNLILLLNNSTGEVYEDGQSIGVDALTSKDVSVVIRHVAEDLSYWLRPFSLLAGSLAHGRALIKRGEFGTEHWWENFKDDLRLEPLRGRPLERTRAELLDKYARNHPDAEGANDWNVGQADAEEANVEAGDREQVDVQERDDVGMHVEQDGQGGNSDGNHSWFNPGEKWSDYSEAEITARLAEGLVVDEWPTELCCDFRVADPLLAPLLVHYWKHFPTAIDFEIAIWQESDLKGLAAKLPKYTMQMLCAAVKQIGNKHRPWKALGLSARDREEKMLAGRFVPLLIAFAELSHCTHIWLLPPLPSHYNLAADGAHLDELQQLPLLWFFQMIRDRIELRDRFAPSFFSVLSSLRRVVEAGSPDFELSTQQNVLQSGSADLPFPFCHCYKSKTLQIDERLLVLYEGPPYHSDFLKLRRERFDRAVNGNAAKRTLRAFVTDVKYMYPRAFVDRELEDAIGRGTLSLQRFISVLSYETRAANELHRKYNDLLELIGNNEETSRIEMFPHVPPHRTY